MTKKAIMGIDPGTTGFITVFAEGKYKFYPMPTHRIETGDLLQSGKYKMKTTLHEGGIRGLVFEIKKDFPGHKFYCAIEKVTGRNGWSAQNSFNFGRVAGLQAMVPIMLDADIIYVRPQKWQNVMYRGFDMIKMPSSTGKTMVNDTKAMSALVSKDWAPDIIFSKQAIMKKDGTTHKIDDNKTDSFLICMYLFKHELKLI